MIEVYVSPGVSCWLAYSRLHHNITLVNAVYAYTMIYNMCLDVEGLSGPTFSLAEIERLVASYEESVTGSEPNLTYISASLITLVLPFV
jgi:hypothetical protein